MLMVLLYLIMSKMIMIMRNNDDGDYPHYQMMIFSHWAVTNPISSLLWDHFWWLLLLENADVSSLRQRNQIRPLIDIFIRKSNCHQEDLITISPQVKRLLVTLSKCVTRLAPFLKPKVSYNSKPVEKKALQNLTFRQLG